MSNYNDSEVFEGELVDAPMRKEFAGIPAGTGALQVRSNYATAVHVGKKRELVEIERRLLTEARLMGESAFYGWGKGDDRVEGPSQELALAAVRNWGNCAIEVAPVVETPDAYLITSYFIDLETGFTMGRPFRMSKRWKVYGKLDDERKADVRFQIGATKSARNVILKAIPGWLIDKALEEAKSGVRAKLEAFIEKKGIAAAQDYAVGALVKLGVAEPAVLAKFGIAARTALDIEKLIILQGDIRALQNGEARASELFPEPPSTEAEAAATSTVETMKQRLAGKGKAKAAPAPEAKPEPAPPAHEGIPADTVAEIKFALLAKNGGSQQRAEVQLSEITSGKLQKWADLEGQKLTSDLFATLSDALFAEPGANDE